MQEHSNDKDQAENADKVSNSELNEPLGVKVITPIVCQLCEMDWQNGACGDCTLTRKQLDGCTGLHRQIELLEQMNDNLRKQLDAALDDHCDSH